MGGRLPLLLNRMANGGTCRIWKLKDKERPDLKHLVSCARTLAGLGLTDCVAQEANDKKGKHKYVLPVHQQNQPAWASEGAKCPLGA